MKTHVRGKRPRLVSQTLRQGLLIANGIKINHYTASPPDSVTYSCYLDENTSCLRCWEGSGMRPYSPQRRRIEP